MARRSLSSRMRRWGVFLLGEIRTGLRRVRGSFLPIAESAAAAALASSFRPALFRPYRPGSSAMSAGALAVTP